MHKSLKIICVIAVFVIAFSCCFVVSADESTSYNGTLTNINITAVNVSTGTSSYRTSGSINQSYCYLWMSGSFQKCEINTYISSVPVYGGKNTTFQFDFFSPYSTLQEALDFTACYFYDSSGKLQDVVVDKNVDMISSIGPAHATVGGLYAYTIRGSFTPTLNYDLGRIYFSVSHNSGSLLGSDSSIGVGYVYFSNPYYMEQSIINNQDKNTSLITHGGTDYGTVDKSDSDEYLQKDEALNSTIADSYDDSVNMFSGFGSWFGGSKLSEGLLAVSAMVSPFLEITWISDIANFALIIGCFAFLIGAGVIAGSMYKSNVRASERAEYRNSRKKGG